MSYPVTVVLRLMHLVLCRHHCLLLLLLLLGNVVTSVGVTVAKVLHFDLRLNLGQVGRRGWCGGHSLHLYGHHARGARKQRKSLSQPWANHKRHGESTKFVSSFLLPFLCFSATLRRSTGGRVSSRKCSHAAWFRTHDDEHGGGGTGGGRGGGNGSARAGSRGGTRERRQTRFNGRGGGGGGSTCHSELATSVLARAR